MNQLIEALTLGILYGLGPCTIFCAPILIPLIISTSKGGREGIMQTIAFGFGRVFSYTLLGIISGYIGRSFGFLISKTWIGVFIMMLGVSILLKYPKKCLFRFRSELPFLLGIVVGLAPCPPLLALLSLALLEKSIFIGALMGLSFGLGTILSPIIVLGFMAGKWAERSTGFMEINIKVCGLFLILLGLWKITTY